MHAFLDAPAAAGRARELTRAVRLVESDPPGSGALVVLTGEAGIGKSTAARHLVEALPSDALRVVGSPLGHMPSPALWPWRQVARGIAAARQGGPAEGLLRILDSRAREDRAPDIGVVESFVDTLLDEAAAGPLVVLLEDVHRFDDLSLVVLEALCGRLSQARLVVVACVRSDSGTSPAVRALVDSFAGCSRVEVVALAGLPRHVLEATVRDVAPRLDPFAVEEAVRLSAGNPLFAIELARALESGGPAGAAGSSSLARLVEARVRAVDEHDVLTALALLGRPGTVSLLGAACGVPGHVVTRIVERAARAGLVRSRGTIGLVEFEHPLFADGVAATAAAGTVQAMHRTLARLVAPREDASGPEAVERARHLVAAGEGGPGTAAACLAAALHEERSGAIETALELAAHGLDSVGGDVATRVGLLRLRGRCLARDEARVPEGVATLQQALVLARAAGEPGPLVHAVLDLGVAHPQHAAADPGWRALLGEAIALTAHDAPERAFLMELLVEVESFVEPTAARRTAQEALRVAEVANDVHAEAAALSALVLSSFGLRDTTALEAALHRFERHGAATLGLIGFPQCIVALSRGGRSQAEQATARFVRASSYQPVVRRKTAAELVHFGLAIASGDADAVRASAEQVLASRLPEAAMAALPMLELWRAFSGQDLAAEIAAPSASAGLGDLLPTNQDLLRTFMLLSACLPVLGGRAPEPSLVAALVGDRQFLLEPADDMHRDLTHAVAALAGAVLGDDALCDVAASALAPYADRFVTLGPILVLGPAGWFAALALEATGRTSEALSVNVTTLDACRAAGFDAWTALCLVQRARLAAGRGLGPASSWAAEAVELARRRGLTPIAEHAERLAPARRRPSTLSPAQARVLELASTGMTNDRIASELGVARSTVEKHLTQAYRRFGVSNRAAAVLAWAAQRAT